MSHRAGYARGHGHLPAVGPPLDDPPDTGGDQDKNALSPARTWTGSRPGEGGKSRGNGLIRVLDPVFGKGREARGKAVIAVRDFRRGGGTFGSDTLPNGAVE